ncbi:hypothetical protein K2173_027620 [Erythroxylum novogranatense]|uniref:Germin-like protein n=1 Tax=Erythroxylum novogranatense TaxID=1862640 RepID=A0AAV8U3G6_9ROSI|nr:hypothetical protein K2173_027620 [Erythroxylum novogranatense]
MKTFLLFSIIVCNCVLICLADCDNLQDFCPTATTGKQDVFINGFPCKTPANATASDFRSSKLSHAGDTDNFLRSSVTIATAADFLGLNTLGLSVARTDLDVDGIVMPHSHPRASEVFFVSKGIVIAGFIDTKNQPFQKFLKEGEVFVFPRGLLHFCLNAGYEAAVVFSVLNSQNPGVVNIAGAIFGIDQEGMHRLVKKLKNLSSVEGYGMQESNLPLF